MIKILQVISKVVFFFNVNVKSMRHFIQVIFADSANEAVVFQFILNSIQLISKSSKCINNETWNEIKLVKFLAVIW